MVEKDYNTVDWKSVVEYDETSPSGLRWIISPANHVKAGYCAGSIGNKNTCWEIGYKKKTWLAHRIVWILFNGSIDNDLCINHKNCNPLDNIISNLELCTIKENNQRAKPMILGEVTEANTSGVNGVGLMVCFNRDRTKEYRYYVAGANKDGKLVRELFSVAKHGEKQAEELAKKRRKEMESEYYE